MALPQVGDGEQIGDGNTNEALNVGRSGQDVKIQPSSTGKIGFFGAIATNQMAALTTTAAGSLNTVQISALVTNQNSMILSLKALGLMSNS